jgi:hypothetical protein
MMIEEGLNNVRIADKRFSHHHQVLTVACPTMGGCTVKLD